MSYLNNFLFRLRQYARDNRDKLIRALVIAAAALFLVLLIYYGVEKIQQWSYERGIRSVDAVVHAKEAEAKAHEARADEIAREIVIKEAIADEWEIRARAAEWKLAETGRAIAPLRKTYEETRDNPDIPADISCADVCARLAALGHACQ